MGKYRRNQIIFALVWITLAMIIILIIPTEVKGKSGNFLEGMSAEFFPYFSSFALLLLSLMLIIRLFKTKPLKANEIKEKEVLKKETSIFQDYGRQIVIIFATIAYIFLLNIWGYLISTILLLGILFLIFSSLSKIKWVYFFIYVTFFPFVLYYFFEKLMMVPLP
ncbi:MAG: tripartite tricarboxylate transporter TctB family protein [Bacillota bacterium]